MNGWYRRTVSGRSGMVSSIDDDGMNGGMMTYPGCTGVTVVSKVVKFTRVDMSAADDTTQIFYFFITMEIAYGISSTYAMTFMYNR